MVAVGSPDPSMLVLLFLESLAVGEGETDGVNAVELAGDELDDGAVLAPKEREKLGQAVDVGKGETDDVNTVELVGDELDDGAVLAPKERERLGQAVDVGEVDGDVVPPPCVAFGCGLTDAERLALFVTVAVALVELLAVPLYDKMHIAVETMGPAPVELLMIARTRAFIESET